MGHSLLHGLRDDDDDGGSTSSTSSSSDDDDDSGSTSTTSSWGSDPESSLDTVTGDETVWDDYGGDESQDAYDSWESTSSSSSSSDDSDDDLEPASSDDYEPIDWSEEDDTADWEDSNRIDDEAYLDDVTGEGGEVFTPDELDDLDDLGVVWNTPGVWDNFVDESTIYAGGDVIEGSEAAVRDAMGQLHDEYAHLLDEGGEIPTDEQPGQPPEAIANMEAALAEQAAAYEALLAEQAAALGFDTAGGLSTTQKAGAGLAVLVAIAAAGRYSGVV